jgi:plastocyanin
MPGLRASKLALAVATIWLLAGCSHTQLVSGDRTLHVALNEYRINPQNVRVSAGLLIIDVRNFGRLTHNLVIMRDGETTDQTDPVPPGQSTNLAVSLEPGKYVMASTILSDQTLGMYGTLTVTH